MNIFKVVLAGLSFIMGVSMVCSDLAPKWDPSGYIMYCPCMGRLGNQIEQFLGALRFSKELNRTLIVPPWVAYDYMAGTSFTPYDAWFDINELKKFHRVMLMHDFMKYLAPKQWPNDGKSRKIYCPLAAAKRSPDLKSCPAKIGSPFGPFWDYFNIEFTGGSQLYSHGALSFNRANAWNSHYPLVDNPVFAFMGAPGTFPVVEENRGLQKYMKWSRKIETQAKSFIKSHLKRPYIAIHLRNGVDWVRACKHIADVNGPYMASAQCTGYDMRSAHELTAEMCLPPKDTIVKKVEEISKLHNASHLFVATDNDAMISEFSQLPLKVVKYTEDYPIMDLALMTMADAFIGNCVSTFTSFVIRNREIEGKANYFFAFDHSHSTVKHEEL